jgi:hypothetical protein
MINILKTLTALSTVAVLATPSFAGDPEVI